MTRGRCLFDILAEVHGNLKAMYPEQIPQFHTSFTSDVYLTKVARTESRRLMRAYSTKKRTIQQSSISPTVYPSSGTLSDQPPDIGQSQQILDENTAVTTDVSGDTPPSMHAVEIHEHEEILSTTQSISVPSRSSMSSIIASIKHSGDSLNNIVTWLPVDDDAAKSKTIRQKNSTRSLFQRLRGKK